MKEDISKYYAAALKYAKAKEAVGCVSYDDFYLFVLNETEPDSVIMVDKKTGKASMFNPMKVDAEVLESGTIVPLPKR